MNSIAQTLLAWYDGHKRHLPWRDIADPYGTWVSETMLQQTRVETVLRYYPRFMERFPTIAALAEAPEADVLKQWEGLGYYSRARNLQAGARQVMADFGGVLPGSVEELRRIRGIGEYTAGAIASIAWGVPVPAVDGNVIRVTCRLKGIRENAGIPSVRRQITAEAAALVPQERPGDFNQAMMDLGATVCTPGTPDCEGCPLQGFCDAFRAEDAEELPVLPVKNPPRVQEYDVVLLLREDRVLVRQRTESMLHGLWEFLLIPGQQSKTGLKKEIRRKTGLPVGRLEKAGQARHVFTHRIWEMKLYLAGTDEKAAPLLGQFVSEEELDALALPSAMRAAREAALKALRGESG